MQRITLASVVLSGAVLLYFLVHNGSIKDSIPRVKQEGVEDQKPTPQYIGGITSNKRFQTKTREVTTKVDSLSHFNAMQPRTASTDSHSRAASTIVINEHLLTDDEPKESIDNPFESWETIEINPDPHCNSSSHLPNQTTLARLEPGTVLEVEKRMRAGASGNDFLVHDGKMAGYGGFFIESNWYEWLKEPKNHPMLAMHLHGDEESVECRVVPRGNKTELRDLKPKRQLILTGVMPSIDVHGEIQPLERALVLVFDQDEGIQTINCSPARDHSATDLTVADFVQTFGNRFDICSPPKNSMEGN